MRALGAACEAVRRLPEARAWYNLAVQTDPLDAAAQKALYRLRLPATQPSTDAAPRALGTGPPGMVPGTKADEGSPAEGHLGIAVSCVAGCDENGFGRSTLKTVLGCLTLQR